MKPKTDEEKKLLKHLEDDCLRYCNQASPNSIVKRMAQYRYDLEQIKKELEQKPGRIK